MDGFRPRGEQQQSSGDGSDTPTEQTYLQKRSTGTDTHTHSHHASHPSGHGAHPSRKRKIINTVKHYARVISRHVMRLTKIVWKHLKRLLKPIIRAVKRFIDRVGWVVIGTTFASILLLMFSIFHFYLASGRRIESSFQKALESSQIIESDLADISDDLADIPAFATDTKATQEQLDELAKAAGSRSMQLPRRLFAAYGLRDVPEASSQLAIIYTPTELSPGGLRLSSKDTQRLLGLHGELFGKKIDQDTDGYISFLQDALKTLETIGKRDDSVEIEPLSRLYKQVLASAEQYKEDGNKDVFDQRFSNLGSEIYKETYFSWRDSVEIPYSQWISARRSSIESILNTL